MNDVLAIQQAATSDDEIAVLASAVTDYQEKLRDAKGYPRINALQQDLQATRQRLAVLFGERHGWHLSRSDFSPSVLARRGLFNGRGYHVDPWPHALVDHGYFYRKDRKAAAVAAHLYGDFDAAKRQDTEATAALYGLRVTWPEDFPSWYLPGRTTLIVCTPLAGPAS
ncbi:hypothetical protein [uncultured Paracoccus sp.]|uniref:hypothetical protein n=1 Tax=uncultured Paracoccus sp. TaxID=189685 RepID=UPI0025D6F33E|nr:hypothetical protein [uncultured Paracoccus sp.]